jgi:hypothetical protein
MFSISYLKELDITLFISVGDCPEKSTKNVPEFVADGPVIA